MPVLIKKRYKTTESRRENRALLPLEWNLAKEGRRMSNGSMTSFLLSTHTLGNSVSENELNKGDVSSGRLI